MGSTAAVTPEPRSPRIWSKAFTAIFVVNAIINLGQFMTVAIIPTRAHDLGASAAIVGLVTGIFAATALAVRPVVGPMSMAVRNNILLMISAMIILVAFVLYSMAGDVAMLVAARLVHGAGMGLLMPVAFAMASSALPPQRIAQGIGIFSLGAAMATALGPPIGLWLVTMVGFQCTFLIGAVLMLAAAGLAWMLPASKPARTDQRAWWRSIIAREAVAPAAVLFLLAGAFSTVTVFVVLMGESRGVDNIGFFFTAYAAVLLVSRPVAGYLSDRYGASVVIVPGFGMFTLAFVLLSQADSLLAFIVAGAVSALGYGVCQPAVQALCLMSVEPSRRGVASNTAFVGVDLAYLIVPAAAGWVVSTQLTAGIDIDRAYSTMYLFATIPVLLAGILYMLVRKRRRTL